MRRKAVHKRAIPNISANARGVVRRKNDEDCTQVFDYACPQHKALPHVVKFSGGRSSGMLLFTLLEKGMLDAGRGDVVVFNNTSAEHPATYAFVRECKAVCEKKYGIPFLWTEFQTYETASAGIYNRLPAYRLVNDRPHSARDNPDGYHCRGEVFEEMISWAGYLPNQFSGRICTSWMKLFVSKEFLRDWFAAKDGVERLGHFGEESRIDPDDIHAAHERNGGRTPKKIFLAKKQFCLCRPLHRPARKFADFSSVADCRKIDSEELRGKSMGGRVRLSGDFGVDYCSFVGFRADEPARLAKMRARANGGSDGAESGGEEADAYHAAPEGEHVYAPLMQFGTSKEDVARFWERRDWNLRLPQNANLSNCVYCFLKGGNALWQLAHRQDSVNRKLPAGLRAQKNAPSDIQWWADLEEKYGRDLVAEGRKINPKVLGSGQERPIIGFFGLNSRGSYRNILQLSRDYKNKKIRGKRRKMYLGEFQNLPCDCTD
ncbi:MAG: hypothetical protein ACR2QC_07565 [Gammaproteobacteria bacterium]